LVIWHQKTVTHFRTPLKSFPLKMNL